MSEIPDRENLQSMSRTDIQKLCKDNNIKANMRTDEMINALCDLVNGKEVPRPLRPVVERVTSQPAPISRRASVQFAAHSKASDTITTTKKAASRPSGFNPDTESSSSAAMPVPHLAVSTRHRAKDLQTHLGKGRPVVAGGTGARKITKVISRGGDQKAKARAMLREPDIAEDGSALQRGVAEEDHTIALAHVAESRPSTRLISLSVPSHLPTPAPSQPPFLSTAQFNALEARVKELESSNLAVCLQQLQQTMSKLPSSATLQQLNDEVVKLTKLHSRMDAQMKELTVENKVLKMKVNELESQIQDREESSIKSHIIHSSARSSERVLDSAEKDQSAPTPVPICNVAATPIGRRCLNDELPDPSPSQPTLGKRARCDSPDGSPNGAATPIDPDRELIERTMRPLRKRQRLHDESDTMPFFQSRCGATEPVITSTPQPGSHPGVGRSESSLVEADLSQYLNFDHEDDDGNKTPSNAPVNRNPSVVTHSVTPHSVPDPNFFMGGPLFNTKTPTAELPFPLQHLRTPPSTSLDPAPLTTPRLGEPWNPEIISDNAPISAQQGLRERHGSDKIQPHFTSGYPSGNRRYGVTPRGFSISLKSPALMPTVPESSETSDTEDSPPILRTMYGTELDKDTRFGDYGREIGKDAWGKWVGR